MQCAVNKIFLLTVLILSVLCGAYTGAGYVLEPSLLCLTVPVSLLLLILLAPVSGLIRKCHWEILFSALLSLLLTAISVFCMNDERMGSVIMQIFLPFIFALFFFTMPVCKCGIVRRMVLWGGIIGMILSLFFGFCLPLPWPAQIRGGWKVLCLLLPSALLFFAFVCTDRMNRHQREKRGCFWIFSAGFILQFAVLLSSFVYQTGKSVVPEKETLPTLRCSAALCVSQFSGGRIGIEVIESPAVAQIFRDMLIPGTITETSRLQLGKAPAHGKKRHLIVMAPEEYSFCGDELFSGRMLAIVRDSLTGGGVFALILPETGDPVSDQVFPSILLQRLARYFPACVCIRGKLRSVILASPSAERKLELQQETVNRNASVMIHAQNSYPEGFLTLFAPHLNVENAGTVRNEGMSLFLMRGLVSVPELHDFIPCMERFFAFFRDHVYVIFAAAAVLYLILRYFLSAGTFRKKGFHRFEKCASMTVFLICCALVFRKELSGPVLVCSLLLYPVFYGVSAAVLRKKKYDWQLLIVRLLFFLMPFLLLLSGPFKAAAALDGIAAASVSDKGRGDVLTGPEAASLVSAGAAGVLAGILIAIPCMMDMMTIMDSGCMILPLAAAACLRLPSLFQKR